MSEKSPRHVCPIGIDEDFLKPTIEHSIHQESTSAEFGSGSTDCCSVDSEQVVRFDDEHIHFRRGLRREGTGQTDSTTTSIRAGFASTSLNSGLAADDQRLPEVLERAPPYDFQPVASKTEVSSSDVGSFSDSESNVVSTASNADVGMIDMPFPVPAQHVFQRCGVDEHSMSTICSFLAAGDLVQLCSTRKNALRGVSVDLMERTVVTKPFHHDRGAYETGPSCSSKAFTAPARTRRSDGVTIFHLSIISVWGGASVRKLSLEIPAFDVVADDLPEEVRLLAQHRSERLMCPLAELRRVREDQSIIGACIEELHLYGRGGWLTWLDGMQFCTNLKKLTFHDVLLNPEAWRHWPGYSTEEMSYKILLRHFLLPITACPLQFLAFYTSEQLVQSRNQPFPYRQITTLGGIGYHSLGVQDSRIMKTLETLIVQRMAIVEIPAGLTALKRVHVVNCPRLDCVMNLEECRLLECVDLRGSVRLDKINGLKKCEWLRRVDLCGTYVRSLTPLERCKCLDLITIDKAVKGWQSFAPGVVFHMKEQEEMCERNERSSSIIDLDDL